MGTQKPRVVALRKPGFIGKDYLAKFEEDFELHVLGAINRKEMQRLLPELIAKFGPVDALMSAGATPAYAPFDEDLLKPLLPQCKIIVSAAAGYNAFDLEWITRNNIWFCNTVDAMGEATADMAMFLILAALKDTTRAERSCRQGNWKTGFTPTRSPSGLTLGIVGMGSIGKYIAKKASAFNMKILYHNRHRVTSSEEERLGATYCPTLKELLSAADVVSISCPLSNETTNLISKDEFAAMKDGSFFVNTSRGEVVDEAALIAALESGKIARAGLDVFHNEPDIDPYFFKSEKVVVQPHMGGVTDVSFEKAERECFENIRALFKTGRPVAPVNDLPTKD